MNLRITYLDSSSIFHILGAVFGINYVLKNIDNPYYWFATDWTSRLIRGIIGFVLNSVFLSLLSKTIYLFYKKNFINKIKDFVDFENLTSDYTIYSIFYGVSGFVCYGYLPLFFNKIGLTNSEYVERKTELNKRKLSEKKEFDFDSNKYNRLDQID